ncbi:MAG TPA: efflux RND transporter periplasmic adaptor subunit [Polyangiaceae bacterium]|nr:efflux RND transporter periplasmic adaptor subunit [Polyangiaceae bacterium]
MTRATSWLRLVSLLATLTAGCRSAQDDSSLKQPKGINKLQYPVAVAPLELRQVSYTVMAPGSIEAFQQVQITARVAGAVDRVSFVEGQEVKQGDVLVAIETDRYQIAVDQAKAALGKVTAQEQAAEAQLTRRQGAVADHPGLIAGEEIAAYQTAVATSKADVAAAREAVRVAELNLRDAYVRAPIAGVVQSRTVQAGQYLQPGAVLATLLQRDPLMLRFGVTEQDAPRIKAGMTANLVLRESTRTYQARIILVAEAADPTTRLVPVTAQVDDTSHKYWLRPGAFCQVDVPVGDARPAIVVPSIAVQPTSSGNVVYVVDDGNIAHLKKVALGMYTPDGGVEITTGLSVGELLVVQGFEALSEGAPVKVTQRLALAEAVSAAGTPSSKPAASAPPRPSARAAASPAPAPSAARAPGEGP